MILAQQVQASSAIAAATGLYVRATAVLQRYGAPVFDLAVRLYIANVFFTSGRTKIADWASTVSLFESEYNVPLLPPELAAILGTTFELAMPLFLVVGLAARFAALPLLAMACVIQFVLGGANADYDNPQHFYWMFLLVMIVIRGAGVLSLDHLIRKRAVID
ncbi:MAG: DoxX family protein [Rhodospirillaceae bacterium]|nr:DoxX family protein [Rhodospirillaceae bacterium]